MTDYEAKFHAEGVKINRLVAVKTERTNTTAAGTPPRLRNASLSDAKGRADSLAAFEKQRREAEEERRQDAEQKQRQEAEDPCE